MKFAFILAQSANHNVSALCRILTVSQSGFYEWRGREPSLRLRTDAVLVVHIRVIHRESRKIYGSPRVAAQLRGRGPLYYRPLARRGGTGHPIT